MSKNIQIIAIILSICISCSSEPEINIKASIAKYNLANEINEKIGEEHFFQDQAIKNINPRLGKALIKQLDSQKIYFTKMRFYILQISFNLRLMMLKLLPATN